MSEVPETLYTEMADGASIAYQVTGSGPPDLLLMSGSAPQLEISWEIPIFARVYERFASFSRLIRFDFRGMGLSDPLALAEQPTLEERAKEILAVLEAAGSKTTAVVANGSWGLFAIFFAASYPTRTSALVLDGCYARLARAPDYPIGVPSDVLDRAVAESLITPGAALSSLAPSARNDPEFVALWERHRRFTYGRTGNKVLSKMMVSLDVRPALSAIQVPTLVLYRDGDRWVGRPHAQYLAKHITGAKLVELRGDDNLIFVGDSDADVEEIEEFLTGARHAPTTDRVLATVLFTDIVGSTQRMTELGDTRWKALLDDHDRVVRRQLNRFRGKEINTVGDGFVATFDGPGRAIQCGCAIRDAVQALGIEIRVGLHTGEIEIRGNDVAGVAVHIGARVEAFAGSGEVLVSSTVKDLVTGSRIEFEDRGEHELKGVPGTWGLFAVRT